MAAKSVSLLIAITVLLLPILLTICLRFAALNGDKAEQKAMWAAYRGSGPILLTITIVAWWVIWDWYGSSAVISVVSHYWPRVLEIPAPDKLLFWVLPTVSLGIHLGLSYRGDRAVFRLKWSMAATFRQAWWKGVSFVMPLLMVAEGFDALSEGRVGGVAWLLAAGVVQKIGLALLRLAEGMKLNVLKSGELRNRAFSLADAMGVTLRRVYSVPAGKGHLTNAYGMSDAIALTDNLGKFLNKMQIEYVIAHELAHVKLKHGRKTLLTVIGIFSATALLLLELRRRASPVWPLLQVVALMGPLLTLYYFSRRHEYSADGEAVDFTEDPETAIRALANLHEAKELRAARNRFAELFMTHPTLTHRIRAIANRRHLSADRLSQILEETG